MTARSFIAWLCLLLLAAGVSCRSESPRPAGGKVRVVASLFPLADLARQVGGPFVEVACLLPPGLSPHGYQPKAQQAEQVVQADLLVTVGLGIDEWATRAARLAASRSIPVLEMAGSAQVSRGIQEQHEEEEHAGEHGHSHEHALGDPHVWLDVAAMERFTGVLAEQLTKLAPEHREAFLANARQYVAALRALDEEYRRTLSPLKHRAFVSFHSAFSYLAKRYGLEQMAVYNADAAGYGPERIEKVAAFIREKGIRVIFAEPQFPVEKLQALSRMTGAKIARMDPEGNPDVPGYDSYLAMMRSNLRTLATAMKD